jgi:membrane-bound lytic murein transglycosylase D
LNETDSLALSIENWPEIDATQSRTASEAADNSPFEIIENDRVDFWIRYFTGPGKDRFERALYRMELHRPTVEPILAELGLHSDLMCVALIESGFNLKARSYARAVGPWQFIAGTARLYGLRVSWWFDERRDIVASTYAAGNYLKDLNGIWDDWLLALAAYNCGEYRVIRAISRQKTNDFWALDLPRQTQRYVPKFLAALYVYRNPEKYGLNIPDVEPVKFDEITVKDATDVKVIARSAGTTVDYILDLNPSLLRWCTPPKTEINVKVPAGTGDECALKLANIPPEERVTWRRHRIRQGETLSEIATAYNTTVTTLKRLNGIQNAHRIRAGKTLIVPVQGAYSEMASSKPQYRDKHRTINKAALEKYAKRYEPPANHKRVVYVVKGGDTLGEIAEVFHTSAKRIRYWNNLRYRSYIHPGQKLVIYVPESFSTSGIQLAKSSKPSDKEYIKRNYTVKKGDTFYSISRKFNVGMVDLISWNGKSSRSVIHPGDVLEIWQKKPR